MKAIVLAAGKSKRMNSKLPKFLHKILGKPMLHYVLDACTEAGLSDLALVVGHERDAVIAATPHTVQYFTQTEQLGTGHAVRAAEGFIAPEDDILILCGDTPLITAEALRTIIDAYAARAADALVVSVQTPQPFGYGRVIAADGVFERIVEQRDLTDPRDDVNEINTGILVCKGEALLYGLSRITNENRQQEYYLTDVPAVLRAAGRDVGVFRHDDYQTFEGVNDQAQLAAAAAVIRRRVNHRLMLRGVRIIDPESVFVDFAAVVEPEAVLYPNVILEGDCHIGPGAVIGPNTRLVDTTVGAETTVQYSVLTGAEVGAYSAVGPFAYLRPGAAVGEHCKIGDFVEVKNARVGDYSKVPHLSYIGDADVGSRVNIGCGVITVNYDGRKKHRTTIADNAFVGCNTNLVAPVTVREGAYVAAGSTITDEVPAGALAIARERQVNKEGWTQKK